MKITQAAGQQIRLSWPKESAGFVLESTPAIGTSPAWTSVAAAAQTEGAEFTVTLPPTSGSRFFRLREVQAAALTRIAESSPANGENGVAVTRETIVRLSAPLASSTAVGNDRFYAEFGGRKILSRAQISADLRTLTLFYLEPLPGSARVRVTLKGDGLKDEAGRDVDADGDGQPGGTAVIGFDTVTLVAVSNTEVCGRVFASELAAGPNGQSVNVPLAGVTVTVDGMEETMRAVTDQNGDFRLSPAPAGDFFVHIDGRTAVRTPENNFPRGAYYPFVGKRWTSVAGAEVNIGNIYLPLIIDGTLKPVSPSQDTLITFPADVLAKHPELNGVTVTVPANALFSDNGVRGGMVGIAPVPPDRLPSPLPPGLNFPLVITVQTDGPSNFDEPVPVCFPNLPDPTTGRALDPGDKSALWSFNHDIGNWEVVGSMTVSADGKLVCSDPGVGIRQPGWHGGSPGCPVTGGNTRNGNPRNPTRPRPNGPQECAHNDCPCAGNCSGGREVFFQSGEEVMSVTDLMIPGRAGMVFRMDRTYRSRLDYNGPIGFGWNFRYNETLFVEANGDITRYTGRSHEGTWKLNPDGTYTSPPGYFGVLTKGQDGIYVLTESDGFQRLFREDGRVICHQDRFNNRMLFDYDERGNLHRVIDVFGREIQFTFGTFPDGVDRLITIEDFIGRTVEYEYDGNGDLVTVTTPAVKGTSTGNDFPKGRTVRYSYSSGFAQPELNHNILSVTAPEEVANGGPAYLQWTYGTDPNDPVNFDRVLSETEGGTNASGISAGGTRTFEYAGLETTEPPGRLDVPRGKARIVERNGNVKEYFVNERQLHILTREFTRGLRPGEPPYYETRSFYDDDGQLVRRILPEGNEVRYVYDTAGPRRSRSNLIETRRVADADRGGGNDLITTYTYEPLFNQVLTMTEPRGNDTSFVPPLGQQSRARYTKRFFYDYQESSGPVPLANLFNVDLSGVPRGLGDLNGDGRTDQVFGNLVRIEAPDVLLRTGSNEASRRGSATQKIISQTQWNDHGQVTARIDPEGNVTDYVYHPENDPDGDGTLTFSAYTALTSQPDGYLKSVVVDGRTSPRRDPKAAPPTAITTSYFYDPVGNIIAMLDPRGVRTDLEVNQLNEVVTVIRGADIKAAVASRQLLTGETAFAYRTRFHFDNNGRVVRKETENRDGNTAGVGAYMDQMFAYDILDNLLSASDEVDANRTLTTRYRYDPEDLLISTVRPEGDSTQVKYDERNFFFTATRGFDSPSASTVQIDYDLNGNRRRLVDAEDNDGDGQPESTAYRYDGFDRCVEIADALGNQLLTTYDLASNPVRVQMSGHPAGKPAAAKVLLQDSRLAYDELNRRYQTDEALFLADGFAVNRPVQLHDENADGFVTTLQEYDALSRLTSTIEDDYEVTRMRYDGAGRAIESMDALGNRLTTQYDQNSNPVRVTSVETSAEHLVPEETFIGTYVYDQLDRLVRTTDNAGHTTYLAYDSRNNLITQSDPEGPIIRDPLSLLPDDINGPGNRVTHTYDGLNRLTASTHDLWLGGVGGGALDTTNPFNADGQVKVNFEWDGNSRLAAVRDDNGNRTSYAYDPLDRRTTQKNADGSTYSFKYDRDGNFVESTDPNGTVVHRTYDVLNRIIGVTVTRPAANIVGTKSQTYEYDGLSRLTRSTDDNGDSAKVQETVRAYDSLSRLVEERQNGRAISSVFAGDGKRLSCTYPGGRRIEHVFDAIDRVQKQMDATVVLAESRWIGPGPRELIRANGNGTTLSFLNDSANADAGYDNVRRPVRHRLFGPDHRSVLLDREYGYNRANHRTFEKRNDDGQSSDAYVYDSLYRIIRTELDRPGLPNARNRDLQSTDYRLDGAGNRRQMIEKSRQGLATLNFGINEMNEYTTVDQTAQTYSDNGNLLDDGQRLLAYDFQNRLIKVARKSDGAPVSEYLYDAENRRRQKTVFSSINRGALESQTLYFYDGWNVCEEQNSTGQTLLTYVHAPAYLDDLIEMQRTAAHPLGAGEFYFHQNVRYDVIALTDATGALAEQRFYDDFGIAYDETKQPVIGSRVGSPYGFQGQRMDAETGLYYFRERYYDPGTGRFLQRDPVWDPVNVGNSYTFAGNGPISGTDPLGLNTPKTSGPPKTQSRPPPPASDSPSTAQIVGDALDVTKFPAQLAGMYGFSDAAKAAMNYDEYMKAYREFRFLNNMGENGAAQGMIDITARLKKFGNAWTGAKGNYSSPSAGKVLGAKVAKGVGKAGAALQALDVAAKGVDYYQKDERVKKMAANERQRVLDDYDRLVKEVMQISNFCVKERELKRLQENLEFLLNNVTDSQYVDHLNNAYEFLRDGLASFIPDPSGKVVKGIEAAGGWAGQQVSDFKGWLGKKTGLW